MRFSLDRTLNWINFRNRKQQFISKIKINLNNVCFTSDLIIIYRNENLNCRICSDLNILLATRRKKKKIFRVLKRMVLYHKAVLKR